MHCILYYIPMEENEWSLSEDDERRVAELNDFAQDEEPSKVCRRRAHGGTEKEENHQRLRNFLVHHHPQMLKKGSTLTSLQDLNWIGTLLKLGVIKSLPLGNLYPLTNYHRCCRKIHCSRVIGSSPLMCSSCRRWKRGSGDSSIRIKSIGG